VSDTFLDLYAALVTPAGIGINVLGETWYAQYTAGRGIDEQMILIAANGPYSFLGPDWEHTEIIVPIEQVQGRANDPTIAEADQNSALPSCQEGAGPFGT
jgi:transcriptional regulator of nitric oxide reductase